MDINYRIELRDRSFNLLEVLDKEIIDPCWEYSRIGGCGGFSFSLPREYCNEKHISGDFNIRIYKWNTTTKTYDLIYQGLVEDKLPSVRGSQEVIEVQGHGYLAQLSRIYIDHDYTSTEVSAIVKDILDNYVVPNTNITYDAGDIVATGFTPDSLSFNTDAKRALQTCADIVGSREWGVDKNRKFFFKARSETVGFRYPLGQKVTDFNNDDSFKDIVNRVIIQGGDVSGTPYTKTYDNIPSQTKYNRRDRVVQNSAITTDTVSAQFAEALFTEFADIVRRARCNMVDDDTIFESTIPIPMFQLLTSGITYGEKKYGTFLYAGRIEYQVNRISYSIGNVGKLKISLQLGQLRPSVSEAIAQLEYELEQQRQENL